MDVSSHYFRNRTHTDRVQTLTVSALFTRTSSPHYSPASLIPPVLDPPPLLQAPLRLVEILMNGACPAQTQEMKGKLDGGFIHWTVTFGCKRMPNWL